MYVRPPEAALKGSKDQWPLEAASKEQRPPEVATKAKEQSRSYLKDQKGRFECYRDGFQRIKDNRSQTCKVIGFGVLGI